jgi:XTP/dITP diphosphohydrolase
MREYRSLLCAVPFDLVTLADLGITTAVQEAAQSYEENARRKAAVLAVESGLLTLADDSGLEVKALGGAPGPLSARYAGEGASDEDRVSHLLHRLRNVPWPERGAVFRCVIALATPGDDVRLFHGECAGVIALEPSGDQGFGYDPVFFLPELGKTMAQLTLQEKNRISHRARACREACRALAAMADGGPPPRPA